MKLEWLVSFTIGVAALVQYWEVFANLAKSGKTIAKIKNLGQIRRNGIALVCWVSVAVAFASLIKWRDLFSHSFSAQDVNGLGFLGLSVANILRVTISPRLCDRGIYWEGKFIPWKQIKSVRWDKSRQNVLIIDQVLDHWVAQQLRSTNGSIEVSEKDKERVVDLIKQKTNE